MGFKNATFGGDSCDVINGMKGSPVPNQAVSNILKSCTKEARSLYSWNVGAVTREVNKIADYLARMSTRFPKGMHVKVDPPEELQGLLEDDRAAFPYWRFMYSKQQLVCMYRMSFPLPL